MNHGKSMDYDGEQAAAKKNFAHDLKCGSVLDNKDPTMWCSVNWKL